MLDLIKQIDEKMEKYTKPKKHESFLGIDKRTARFREVISGKWKDGQGYFYNRCSRDKAYYEIPLEPIRDAFHKYMESRGEIFRSNKMSKNGRRLENPEKQSADIMFSYKVNEYIKKQKVVLIDKELQAIRKIKKDWIEKNPRNSQDEMLELEKLKISTQYSKGIITEINDCLKGKTYMSPEKLGLLFQNMPKKDKKYYADTVRKQISKTLEPWHFKNKEQVEKHTKKIDAILKSPDGMIPTVNKETNEIQGNFPAEEVYISEYTKKYGNVIEHSRKLVDDIFSGIDL